MKLFNKSFYEKLFTVPEPGIGDYYKQIKDAQGKIAELQAKCNHMIFKVHMYMWRPGAMQPQRICNSCNAVVPGITEEEANKAWEEWHSLNNLNNQDKGFT
jgi:uncharacterized protein with PIN domain